MDPTLNQKLADFTMRLIDTCKSEDAELVNTARSALTDLTKKFEYCELEIPRPESIGQGHRIIIMMKAEIDRLKQEVEDLIHENNALQTGTTDEQKIDT